MQPFNALNVINIKPVIMKHYIFYKTLGFAFIVMALTTGCEDESEIKGSGDVTTQRRSVQEFQKLDISGVLTIYLQQADNHKVEVVTDDNLQHIVDVESVNGTLYVRTHDETDYEATRMDVYISTPDLSAIRLDGVTAMYCPDTLSLTNIYIEKANTGFMEFRTIVSKITIESYDVGEIELHGKAVNADIINNMIGDISAYGFKTEEMYLSHGGTGEVEVYVSDSLEVIISGVGDVHCKGYPNYVEKSVTGVGKVFIEQ